MGFTVVYLVGGLSSRFGGNIKAFAEVGKENETLIDISVNQAIKSGFNNIIFVVSEKTEEAFREKFSHSYKGVPVEYAFQECNYDKRKKPWGTCDAICSAIGKIDGPFVVCTGDDLYGEKTFRILFNHLANNNGNASISKPLIDLLPKEGEVNRGIFIIDDKSNVIDMQEIQKISRENIHDKGLEEKTPASISIFALNSEVLNLLKDKLGKFKEENKDSAEAECYLNVMLGELIKEGRIKMKIYPTEENWLGITNPGDEEKIRKELNKK